MIVLIRVFFSFPLQGTRCQLRDPGPRIPLSHDKRRRRRHHSTARGHGTATLNRLSGFTSPLPCYRRLVPVEASMGAASSIYTPLFHRRPVCRQLPPLPVTRAQQLRRCPVPAAAIQCKSRSLILPPEGCRPLRHSPQLRPRRPDNHCQRYLHFLRGRPAD
jgi:hypothetical protein